MGHADCATTNILRRRKQLVGSSDLNFQPLWAAADVVSTDDTSSAAASCRVFIAVIAVSATWRAWRVSQPLRHASHQPHQQPAGARTRAENSLAVAARDGVIATTRHDGRRVQQVALLLLMRRLLLMTIRHASIRNHGSVHVGIMLVVLLMWCRHGNSGTVDLPIRVGAWSHVPIDHDKSAFIGRRRAAGLRKIDARQNIDRQLSSG
mmetsp:Transcript_19654/g.55540  ORF Transcript_19654/g.55540 Transcript_19654/m.55540 type:complete len:207 (+) Transcript_19654:1313-1933(+)